MVDFLVLLRRQEFQLLHNQYTFWIYSSFAPNLTQKLFES